MKDFMGNELNIGDRVVWISRKNEFSSKIGINTVTGVSATGKRAWLDNKVCASPERLIRVLSPESDSHKPEKEYAWSFDEDEELWVNGPFGTVEECIEEAREARASEWEDVDSVYVGECVPFEPRVNAMMVLDQIQNDAMEQLGEVAGEWEPLESSGDKKRKDIEELEDALTGALNRWFKNHHNSPNFCYIENIKSFEI